MRVALCVKNARVGHGKHRDGNMFSSTDIIRSHHVSDETPTHIKGTRRNFPYFSCHDWLTGRTETISQVIRYKPHGSYDAIRATIQAQEDVCSFKERALYGIRHYMET